MTVNANSSMTGIYIDDSGTPGIKSKSKYDTTDRKTWIALILKPEQRKEASLQIQGCIDEIKEIFNASEFHFTDIYSGKKEFKSIDLSVRLNIFRAFAEIFRLTEYPLIIQTFTSDDILRNGIIVKDKKIKVDNFNLSDTSDFALLFLLFRIKSYLQENKQIPLPVEIIIDEGRQKKNTTQKIELLEGYIYNQEISYKSSAEEPILQLIDFVAFSTNKMRWILTNDKKTDLDFELLKIFERANFNILNIQKKSINFKDHSVEDYDNALRTTYDKNNNLTDIELAKLKDMLNK